MIREVAIVPAAQTQRFCSAGLIKRKIRVMIGMSEAMLPARAQSKGALYGIGIGV